MKNEAYSKDYAAAIAFVIDSNLTVCHSIFSNNTGSIPIIAIRKEVNISYCEFVCNNYYNLLWFDGVLAAIIIVCLSTTLDR